MTAVPANLPAAQLRSRPSLPCLLPMSGLPWPLALEEIGGLIDEGAKMGIVIAATRAASVEGGSSLYRPQWPLGVRKRVGLSEADCGMHSLAFLLCSCQFEAPAAHLWYQHSRSVLRTAIENCLHLPYISAVEQCAAAMYWEVVCLQLAELAH